MSTSSSKATTVTQAPAAYRLSDEDRQCIEQYLEQSLAVNTRRSYNMAWRAFLRYCNRKHVRAFPADPITLMDYVTWLAGVKKISQSSIQVAVAALTYIHDHVDTGTGMPAEDRHQKNPARDPRFQQVFRGVRRATRAPKAVKQPLTIDLIERIAEVITKNTLADARLKALILVGFAGAFRRSELVGIELKHVDFQRSGMTIALPSSKTDQEGPGDIVNIPYIRAKPQVCPVVALKRWINMADITDGPIFRQISKHGSPTVRGLSPPSVGVLLKEALSRAGLEDQVADFGAHSLRAGFVTSAAEAGEAEWKIMQVTRHRSTSTLRQYIRNSGEGGKQAISNVFNNKRRDSAAVEKKSR